MTKNFNKSEFECSDGSEMNIAIYHNMVKVANQLQILRNYIGKPITINSGYRSESYNSTLKNSSKKSQHVMGRAADIVVKGMTPLAVHTAIELLIDKGDMLQGGLGLYEKKGFVHYDIRGIKSRWNG